MLAPRGSRQPRPPDTGPGFLRDENQFMATNFRNGDDPAAKGDAIAEATAFLDAGVDGIFTDQTDTTVEARLEWEDASAEAS